MYPAQRSRFPAVPPARPQRRLSLKVRCWLLAGCLVIAGSLYLQGSYDSAHAAAIRSTETETAAAARRTTADFDRQLDDLFADNPGISFSVATVSAASGLQLHGSPLAYNAASVGKLITATAYLHLVETSQAQLHQRLNGQDAGQLLRDMIIKSDDNAWLTLNDYIGHGQLADYARHNGLEDYTADDDSLPADDVAVLLAKLYSGHLLNSDDRSLLLGYMRQANYRQYIVPAVPAGDTVYHKVGFNDDNLHDAAIITKGDQSLVLVIFTDGHGQYDWDKRAQVMQAITRAALNAYLP